MSLWVEGGLGLCLGPFASVKQKWIDGGTKNNWLEGLLVSNGRDEHTW